MISSQIRESRGFQLVVVLWGLLRWRTKCLDGEYLYNERFQIEAVWHIDFLTEFL